MQLPDFLHRDPDGEIRLVGHRLRLIDVAARYDEGHSAEGIVADIYPSLTLPLVYKTIAFYLENQSEVSELIAENRQAMERLEAEHRATPTFEELRRRMERIRRAAAS